MTNDQFQDLVRREGKRLYRPMPWRDNPSLYAVIVSELMLQQTQVSRVLPKFAEFMARFPNFDVLAAAALPEVLQAWQGLGYNRRAKFLYQTAQAIAGGASTATQKDLMQLPGIGANTAGAIMNYVHQIPTPFVETNIRTVYFHHYYTDEQKVSDKQLLALVERTMDVANPREWFWALMDYGAYLKSQGVGNLTKSRHYKKQSAFDGSVRQLRGEIIRRQAAGQSLGAIERELAADHRWRAAVTGLQQDGLLDTRG